MSTARMVLIALAIGLVPGASHARCETRGARVMVLPFAELGGADDGGQLTAVGQNVGLVFVLQILLTLKTGRGIAPSEVMWETRIREPVRSHADAERVAREGAKPPQLVLWGTMARYGDWLMVSPHLTVLPDAPVRTKDDRFCRRVQTEIWRTPGGGPTVGLPGTRYDFEPVALSEALAERYAAGAGLTVYRVRRADGRLLKPLGTLGARPKALAPAPGALKVRTHDRQVGWIDVSGLERLSTPIAFTGGLIRLMRADYPRASASFLEVTRRDETPAGLRVDALLLRALSEAHRDRPRLALLEAAETINPFDVEVARARIVEAFRREPSRAFERFVQARRYLFDPADRIWDELEPPGPAPSPPPPPRPMPRLPP